MEDIFTDLLVPVCNFNFRECELISAKALVTYENHLSQHLMVSSDECFHAAHK